MSKQNLLRESEDNLKAFFNTKNLRPNDARELHKTLWQRLEWQFPATNTDLSTHLRGAFYIPEISIYTSQQSNDGTFKCSISLHDKCLIEAVLIPSTERVTICVSSQVGCSLSCKFCATGYLKYSRNLGYEEIIAQIKLLQPLAIQRYGMPISNIVFMGMGEPLLNYKEVLQSIRIMQDQRGLSIAPKRTTVSTAGIAKMIRKLGQEQLKLNLALSLHAADDEKRNEIMAINEHNNLQALTTALQDFHKSSNNPITLEYALMKGFNDTAEDAEKLIHFYKQNPIHLVNLIEYNPIGLDAYQKTERDAALAFSQILLEQKVNVRIRRSRGNDIDAACGQLANKSLNAAKK